MRAKPPRMISPDTRSGWAAANVALSEPPSEMPNATARSLPAASSTTRMSSIRSSSVGRRSGGSRSESPVPRLSHMITRPSVVRRSSQRACAGTSQAVWKDPIQPKVTRMSRSPSPNTS